MQSCNNDLMHYFLTSAARSTLMRENEARCICSYLTLYTSTTTIGFSADIDTQLMQAVNITSCMEHEKCVGFLVDEMHLKEDIVFDKLFRFFKPWRH